MAKLKLQDSKSIKWKTWEANIAFKPKKPYQT